MRNPEPLLEPLEAVSEALGHAIESSAITVPMLPEVAGRVVQLTQDPDSDAAQLSGLIQSDQTLAAHVMRVANSAAYSPNSSIVSLQQAIARLGMSLITEIAVTASINSTMFNTPGFENHIHYELRYSLATGLWAKEIARACRKNVETSFLAGLLHDIGRPIAVQCALDQAQTMDLKLSNEEVICLENRFQREIGIRVVDQWDIPVSVRNVVAFFDQYQDPHDSQPITMSVVAGSLIANHFMNEIDESMCLSEEELKNHPVFEDLNIYPEDLESILEKQDTINGVMEAMAR